MAFVFVSMNLLDTVNETAKATSHDAASLKIKLLRIIVRTVFSVLFTSTSYHVKILTFNAIF